MEVQETFGQEVRIIGVAGASNDPAAMAAFVESTGSGAITHIPDLDGSLWERFGARHRMYLYINDDGTSRVGGYGNLPSGVEQLIGRSLAATGGAAAPAWASPGSPRQTGRVR